MSNNSKNTPPIFPTGIIPREPVIPPHNPNSPSNVPSSPPKVPPVLGAGGVAPPVLHHGSGPGLTAPPLNTSSQPPVLHHGSGPILTPPPTVKPGGSIAIPPPPNPILPPGPIGNHTLTVFASSPGRIWSMHQNAYVLSSTSTRSDRVAQAQLYPWTVASGMAVYDNDATGRHATLFWLVDFVKKVKSVAGVEPPFLTLLYALRKSTDAKVKATLQDAVNTWNTYGKKAVGTLGSTSPFFFDVETHNLFILSDSTMNELRNGAHVSDLNTMSAILANVALEQRHDPFGRSTTPAVAHSNVVSGHPVLKATPANAPGTPATAPTKPPSEPKDPWSVSDNKAKNDYFWKVFSASGKIIGGVVASGKLLAPSFANFVPASEESLIGIVGSVTTEMGIIEGGIAGGGVVAEALIVGIAALGFWEVAALGIVAITVTAAVHEIVAATSDLDAKTQLHSCNVEYPGDMPVLSLTNTTVPTAGLPNTSVGGGSSADGKPTLTSPVHGGSDGPDTHGSTGSQPPSTGPGGPQLGPPAGHPTTSPGSGGGPGNVPNPGSQPTGQPIDDPDRPGREPIDLPAPGGNGGTEGPTTDPNTTNPRQPGGQTNPNEPNNPTTTPNEPQHPTEPTSNPPSTPDEPPEDPDTKPNPGSNNPNSPPPKDNPPPKNNPPPKDNPPPKTPVSPDTPVPIDPNFPNAHHGGDVGGGGGGGGLIDPNTGRRSGPTISTGDIPDPDSLPVDNPVRHGP